MREIKLEIYGRVQGVNFRLMVKEFSDRVGLNGYVMNRDDGSVEIVAQGWGENIDKLVKWIKSNPGISKVENIKVEKKEISERFKEFRILRSGALFEDKGKGLLNLAKRPFK